MKFPAQNKLLGLVAALAILSAGSAQAALVNAGFETGDLTSWNSFGDSITVVTTDPNTGAYHADLSADDADPNYAGMYQDQAASGGQLWNGSIWARLVSSPGGNAMIRLKLEFIVGGSPVQIDDALLTTVSGSYTQLTVSGIAPVGATIARLTPVVELNGELGSMQGFFDDAALTLIPEPAAITMLAPAALMLIRRRRV
ncbi:hypothetical protein HED60_24540 [Planctomycetales bacterium ZRK34]|nr:hypothetical protein HED60_24540 [Planctomycetales bacterium ZRK34]